MQIDSKIIIYLLKFLLDLFIISMYMYFKLYTFNSIVNLCIISSIVPVTIISLTLYIVEDDILFFFVSFLTYPFLFFSYFIYVNHIIENYNLHVAESVHMMSTNIQNIPIAKSVGIADMQINGIVYTSDVDIVE